MIFSDQQVNSTSLYYDLSLGVRSAAAVIIRTPSEKYFFYWCGGCEESLKLKRAQIPESSNPHIIGYKTTPSTPCTLFYLCTTATVFAATVPQLVYENTNISFLRWYHREPSASCTFKKVKANPPCCAGAPSGSWPRSLKGAGEDAKGAWGKNTSSIPPRETIILSQMWPDRCLTLKLFQTYLLQCTIQSLFRTLPSIDFGRKKGLKEPIVTVVNSNVFRRGIFENEQGNYLSPPKSRTASQRPRGVLGC